MSVNALVVFRDGTTRVVEVPSPAPRDYRVVRKVSVAYRGKSIFSAAFRPVPDDPDEYIQTVTVFRPQGSDYAPIYEEA
jgi:hypothetical protein